MERLKTAKKMLRPKRRDIEQKAGTRKSAELLTKSIQRPSQLDRDFMCHALRQ